MHQLIKTQLALVTGGASMTGAFQPRNSMFGNIEANPKSATNYKPSNIASIISSIHDNADWHSDCRMHQPIVAPKNGDRNSLGQQYSWGTWWDDMS